MHDGHIELEVDTFLPIEYMLFLMQIIEGICFCSGKRLRL